MTKLFDAGEIFVTQGVQEKVDTGYVALFVKRHLSGDFGELDDEDFAVNTLAMRQGGSIHSVYDSPQGKVWVITSGSKTSQVYTTVLLPEEY